MKNTKKYEYKGISKRTHDLLSGIEDYDVEFKESFAGLDSKDVIAFANSDEGGTILIGIKEIRSGKNKGKGKIVGCRIGDKEKQSIIGKAENCSPPVNIEIYAENLNKTPFYRIEIFDNENKPYCTSSGTYKIRGDGRNKALLPGRLLSMFVEAESGEFIERYKKATEAFEERMEEILYNIESISDKLEDKFTEVVEKTEELFLLSDDIFSRMEETFESISEIRPVIYDIDKYNPAILKMLEALIVRFKIDPPYLIIMKRAKDFVLSAAIGMMTLEKKKEDVMENIKFEFPWISDEKLKKWFKKGIEEFERMEREKEK